MLRALSSRDISTILLGTCLLLLITMVQCGVIYRIVSSSILATCLPMQQDPLQPIPHLAISTCIKQEVSTVQSLQEQPYIHVNGAGFSIY